MFRDVSVVLATVHSGVMTHLLIVDLSIYLSERVINTQIVDGQPFLSPESCGVACNEHVGLRPLGVC